MSVYIESISVKIGKIISFMLFVNCVNLSNYENFDHSYSTIIPKLYFYDIFHLISICFAFKFKSVLLGFGVAYTEIEKTYVN